MALIEAVADRDRQLGHVHGWKWSYFCLGPRGMQPHLGVQVD